MALNVGRSFCKCSRMRPYLVLLAAQGLAVPVKAYNVGRGSIAQHEDPEKSNQIRTADVIWRASDLKPEHKALKYFDTGLPPFMDQSELKGHAALDTVHGVALYVVMPGMGVLAFVILVGSWMSLQRYTALIPESAWQVFLSAVFGFFVRGLLNAGVISDHKYVWASATFLNLFLLPIIIFQSGWALNHYNFLSQLEYIGIFAVFGTLISFFFIGLVGYWLGQHGYFVVSGLRENLAFAALISAVDPVATLSTFSKLGLDATQPLLHTMIFGESVINDAVAIVLFHTINSSWEDLTVVHCIQDIAVLLFGSAGFGILLASVLVWFLRIARLPGDTIPETLYIVCSAWLIFAAAEGAGLSGIIANLVAGSIFRGYGAMHLEEKGLHRTDEFLEVSAHLMDSLVFILCGASTALINSYRGLTYAIFGFVLCLLGRALSTSSCAVVSNSIKHYMQEPQSHFITFNHQCMMWHAGLRGGIALLLALELDASWCHHKATLINATFIIICATLVLLGSTTEPLLRVLGLGGARAESTESRSEDEGKDGVLSHKMASLMDEVHDDGAGGRKRRAMTAIHNSFKFALVGDVSRATERRKRKRDFVQSIKCGFLLTAQEKQDNLASPQPSQRQLAP
mmetsp:Transcript_73589/g.215898  ORF Transcript_73589/g.215898 Transcript_73589/m.215898 type:complete len:627 (+) Transcript_73589:18-1898(+)